MRISLANENPSHFHWIDGFKFLNGFRYENSTLDKKQCEENEHPFVYYTKVCLELLWNAKMCLVTQN